MKGAKCYHKKIEFFFQYENCRATGLSRVSNGCPFRERGVSVLNFKKKFSIYEFVKVYN